MPKDIRAFTEGFLEGLGSPALFIKDILSSPIQLEAEAPLRFRRRGRVARHTEDWAAELSTYLSKVQRNIADSAIGAKPGVRLRPGR